MALLLCADASAYAHYVFNTFDHDHNGSISFEVRAVCVCVRVCVSVCLSVCLCGSARARTHVRA